MTMPGWCLRPGRIVLVAISVASLLLSGCSSASVRESLSTPATTNAPTTTTTAPEEPGWTTLSVGPHGIAIDEKVFTQADGTLVTVARFLYGHVNYSLHIGSQDPPSGGATLGPESGSAVSAAEQPLLLACFNGGFKVAAGVGGTDSNGTVLVPLMTGEASLVLDRGGNARLGIWGSTLPTVGESVASVRQNLPPLIVDGRPTPDVATWQDWGATLGGIPRVPRSALGEDSKGDLLYAAAASSLPVDLSSALVSAGATTGMELDINYSNVQFDTAATPGGPLVARIPGQIRPADQCLAGWVRDFVAVLATG